MWSEKEFNGTALELIVPQMPQKKSRPHLPPGLIQQVESDPSMVGYESSIYDDEAHEFRLGTRDWTQPWNPDMYRVLDNSSLGFTVEMGRTSLHLAAAEGDVLLVHELLRLSATADIKDNDGVTPLYLALSQAAAAKSSHSTHKLDGTGIMKLAERERHASRTTWAARILTDQHADVNLSVNGLTPLHLACMAHSWDTISLLLKHGANPLPASSYFTSGADKRRFSSLVESIGPVQTRPPRVCPCWSGEIVENCHGKEEQVYPLEFICICGSTKTYRRCCYSRKSYALEVWDWKKEHLTNSFDIALKAPACVRETAIAVKEHVREADKLYQLLGDEQRSSLDSIINPTPSNPIHEQLVKMARALLAEGSIDPAFAYTMERVDFIPKPHSRNNSRHLCEGMQQRWNTMVDEYITLGRDKRLRKEVEMAAKIGTWNGALIRTCEGFNCEKIEGRDVSNLKLCSKCKIAVYCGPECQKSAWSTHKSMCCSEYQCEQALPSQKAIQMYHEAIFARMSEVVASRNEKLSEIRASLTQNPDLKSPAGSQGDTHLD